MIQPVAEKAPNKFLQKLRGKVTLNTYITVIVFVFVSLSSAVAAMFAFNAYYEKSLRDIWAIMYLDSERRATAISEGINRQIYFSNANAGSVVTTRQLIRKPVSILKIRGKKARSIWGFKFKGVRFFDSKDGIPIHKNWIFSRGRKHFVVRRVSVKEVSEYVRVIDRDAKYLMAWRIKIPSLPKIENASSSESGIEYIVSTEGALVKSSTDSVRGDNFHERVLIKEFLKSRLSRGEIEYRDQYGVSSYGFYMEIPGTNLIIFHESSKEKTLSDVNRLIQKFGLILILVLGVSLLLVQLSLKSVSTPLKELIWLSGEISNGNFNVAAKTEGFGEIRSLLGSFTNMAKKLVNREESLKKLMEENKHKTKMEREIQIASNVQDNFLPKTALSIGSGLLSAHLYTPAEDVAGDWFNVEFDANLNQTIIAVADVSGHDMAASMYTAVIASVFQDIRYDCTEVGKPFDTDKFITRLNHQIVRFGKKEWHATLVVFVYDKKEDEVTIVNCGHTFPLVVKAVEGKRKAKSIRTPSDPIGLNDEVQSCTKKVKLGPGDTMLLYTDGILESRDRSGKVFGARKLASTFADHSGAAVHEIVDALDKKARDYRDGLSAQDDICLIAIKKAV